jgi:hypothetical protein
MPKAKRSRKVSRKKPAARRKTPRRGTARRKAKPARRSVKRPAKRVAKKGKKRPAKRVAKKARKRRARRVAKKARKRPAKRVAKKARKRPAKRVAKKARKRPAKRAAKKRVRSAASKRKGGARRPSSRKRAASRKASPRRFPKAPAGAARTSPRKFSLKRLTSRLAPQVRPPIEAYRGSKPYAFASYSHKNMKEVFGVIKKLADARFRIWYDEGIEPGNEWPEEVGKALTGCELFLVFMSPSAMDSRNVRNEINFASSENKSVMVVFLQPTELSEGMKLQIGTVQFINKFEMNEVDFIEKMKKVLSPDLRI